MIPLSRLLIAGVLLWPVAPVLVPRASAQANDEVTLKDGTSQSGKILAENYDALQLQVKKGVEKKLEWNTVASVQYGAPPAPYTEAMETLGTAPEEALPKFQALAANDKLRDVLRQNSMLQVAQLQQQLGRLPDAVAGWQALAKTFPQGRYLGAAARGIVDCYLAQDNAVEAGRALEVLARDAQAASAPAGIMAEVGVLRGRILEAQGKFSDARAAYEAVESQAGLPPEVLASARLRVAECLKAEGKAADAESRFQQIVNGEGSAQLLAGGWNGLGDLLLEQGKQKRDTDVLLQALYAYLRGVVQYVPAAGEPTDEHERAIAGTSTCFHYIAQLEPDKERKAAYDQRATEELGRLKKQFPNSKYLPK